MNPIHRNAMTERDVFGNGEIVKRIVRHPNHQTDWVHRRKQQTPVACAKCSYESEKNSIALKEHRQTILLHLPSRMKCSVDFLQVRSVDVRVYFRGGNIGVTE